MIGKPTPAVRGKLLAMAAGILAMAWSAASAPAQTPTSSVFGATPTVETRSLTTTSGFANDGTPRTDSDITPAGCSSCGGGVNYDGPSGGGCSGCGGGCPSCCYAGKKRCDCNFGDNCLGRTIGGMYECLCCPDPCYEPCWIPAANAAFFTDAARPVTQMRWRYDAGFNYTHLDRSEYLMPKFNTTPTQLGPAGPGAAASVPGKGPAFIAGNSTIQDLSLYMEGAIGNFGMFTEFFYRNFEPTTAANSPGGAFPTSGFGDMIIGTKSLLLDCELSQLAFQFKTFIPIGNFTRALGTGHVSLEPALLGTCKISPMTYFQWQTAYWIPIGGDPLYMSNIWHNHCSFNHVLCKPCTGCQLIGTLEFNEWTVMQGAYTSPDLLIGGTVPSVSASTCIFSAGPGVRLVICNYLDFGVGSAFALSAQTWSRELVRTEFRWRF